jgi:hypothetical protein
MSNIYQVTETDGFVRDIIADEPFVQQYYPGRWVLIGPEPAPPPPPPVITKVAMISRFTPQEYVGVVGATKTDVEVQAWYDLFQAASVVDLSDQRTVAGINALVPKNLLTQARADAILTDSVQPNERPL